MARTPSILGWPVEVMQLEVVGMLIESYDHLVLEEDLDIEAEGLESTDSRHSTHPVAELLAC